MFFSKLKNLSSQPKTNRYLSFTFDDGFINGAKKIDKILSPHKATFYIVTGWVKPNQLPIVDAYNQGVNHGTIEDWKNLSDLGHDIGSHSSTHQPANEVNDIKEYTSSLEFIKKIHNGPYNFAYPYHIESNFDLPFDSIRIGSGKKIYNDLKKINFKKIISLNLIGKNSITDQEKFFKNFTGLLKSIPSNSWLVLTLHSVDGEGWGPCTSDELEKILKIVLDQKYQIKTVAEMVKKFK